MAIKHIFYSNGSHCLEVEGTRGRKTPYEHVAFHPCGYAAMTDYYADDDFTPAGGMVWKITPVQFENTETVSSEVARNGLAMNNLGVAYALFIFEDKRYDEETPEAILAPL